MASPSEIPFKLIGSQHPTTVYVQRKAVRAVVLDALKQQIAIIHVKRGNYYKLPGGGIEGDEDHKTALQREILEEIGCEVLIEDMTLIGQSEEFRNDLHQLSFCYFSRLGKDTGEIELTEDEIEDGLQHMWVPTGKALQLMHDIQPTSELGKFIKDRDMFFVKTFSDSHRSSR